METILQFSRWLHDLPDVPKTFISIILIWFLIWFGIRVYMLLRFVFRLVMPKRKKKTASTAVKSFPKVPEGCKVYTINKSTGEVFCVTPNYHEGGVADGYIELHAVSMEQAVRQFNKMNNTNPLSEA